MDAADLVLEGGGVKGAGLAGAVATLSEKYTFHRVAGTSAGAIVASFVAAGLTSELESIMVSTDFSKFEDQGGGLLRYLGHVGQAEQVLFHEGMFKGEALHAWIASTLFVVLRSGNSCTPAISACGVISLSGAARGPRARAPSSTPARPCACPPSGRARRTRRSAG